MNDDAKQKKRDYDRARYLQNKDKPKDREKINAYQRALYAKNKQDPEWRAIQLEKQRARQADPIWAAKRRDRKRIYDESVQNDPEKRKKRNKTVNEWRRKNREKVLKMEQTKWAAGKETRQKKPAKYILRNIKCRALKNNIPFNLEESDIVIPKTCPILGIPIAPFQDGLKKSSVSIDRVDPQKGYTKGNITVISMLANAIKRDCTDPEVFRKIADYIEANLDKSKTTH